MTKKPEPVVTEQVCSLCGLDWALHSQKKAPSPIECIDLLRAELATRPRHLPLNGQIWSVPPASPQSMTFVHAPMPGPEWEGWDE